MTIRELPFIEWQRLVTDGAEPYASHGLPHSDEHWRIIVAEDDTGKIVGAAALHTEVHFDPWWIADSHTGNVAVVRGLLRSSASLLRSLAIDHAFVTIDDQRIATQDQAERLGFVTAPGQLYLLDLNNLKEF